MVTRCAEEPRAPRAETRALRRRLHYTHRNEHGHDRNAGVDVARLTTVSIAPMIT
jgi:hypothetical protein